MAAACQDKRLRVAALLAAISAAKPFDPTRAVAVLCGRFLGRGLAPGNVPVAAIWMDVAYALTVSAAQLDDAAFLATASEIPVLGDPFELFESYAGPALSPPSGAQLAAAVHAVQLATAAASPGSYTAGVPLSSSDAEAVGAGRVAVALVASSATVVGVPAGQVPEVFSTEAFRSGVSADNITNVPASIEDATQAFGARVADVVGNAATPAVLLQAVDTMGTSISALTGNLDIDMVLRNTPPPTTVLETLTEPDLVLTARSTFDAPNEVMLNIRGGTTAIADPSALVLFVTPTTRLGGPL